jgi:hypothetical protein
MDHEQRILRGSRRQALSTASRPAHVAVAVRESGTRSAAAGRDRILALALPADALDDRIAIVGTAGSGKTYAAKGFVERLLDSGARMAIVYPLGVWWGLRASVDGSAPGYPVIVFGGRHADVPISAEMGAALGHIVAREALVCVVDLSELGSNAARRRFMASFSEALYEANEDPLHLILDEADLWAPQRPIKGWEGLLGHIEEIVRRGRVRGFIPWLITQRPSAICRGCSAAKAIYGRRGTGFSIASPFRRSAPSTARARQSASNASQHLVRSRRWTSPRLWPPWPSRKPRIPESRKPRPDPPKIGAGMSSSSKKSQRQKRGSPLSSRRTANSNPGSQALRRLPPVRRRSRNRRNSMKKTAAENRAETGAAGCHAGRRSIEQRHSPGRAQAARRGGTARTRAVYLGPAHDTCRPQAQRRPFQRRPQASARRRLCCRNKRPGDGDAERIEDGWRSAARAVDAGRAAGDVVRPSSVPGARDAAHPRRPGRGVHGRRRIRSRPRKKTDRRPLEYRHRRVAQQQPYRNRRTALPDGRALSGIAPLFPGNFRRQLDISGIL